MVQSTVVLAESAFVAADNASELNCQAEGETFYYSFANRVEDGTRCVPGSLDVCIGGECMVFIYLFISLKLY